MSWKDKIFEKKEKMQKKLDRAREESEQAKAEKRRSKIKKVQNMKPGARKAISEGVMLRKSPMDVMREEYERRKQEIPLFKRSPAKERYRTLCPKGLRRSQHS